ncbi:DNA polymerase III subunit beta [Blattabacterium cuenoti]|uniref:DNA polymerase III subunit beta n=1 Tax=Blattabacterium cuenoti TaxID=1653831 RepID=UPI00163D31C2|nr:DNA polymerase III subunit beta [Blattabacterium cuenoti]
MYFFVSSYSLLQKLHTLYRIINHNNSNAEFFIFRIIKNKLEIKVLYDYENVVNTFIKINVKKNTKEEAVISTNLIINVLSTFHDEMLLFKKKKNSLSICSKQGTCEVPISSIHKHSIDFLRKKRSILVKSTSSIKITLYSNVLLKILNKTLFAVGNKEFKPILNGVLFQFSPYEANFVSTDTFRMVKYTIKNLKFDRNIEFTVPKKSLNIIREILKNENNSNIVIEYKNNINIVFHFENHIFSCKLINEKYPDYNSVIPNRNWDVLLIINRLLLLNTIRRISIFSKKNRNNFIYLHLNRNNLKICEFEQENINNFESNIKCKPIFDGLSKLEKIKMGFNSKFLIEILSCLNENFILFELHHSKKIGILRPCSDKYDKKEESIFILIMSTI